MRRLLLILLTLALASCASPTGSDDATGDLLLDDVQEETSAAIDAAIDAVTGIADRVAVNGRITDDVLDAAFAAMTDEDIDPYLTVSAFHPGSEGNGDAVVIVAGLGALVFDLEAGSSSAVDPGVARCVSPRSDRLEVIDCPAALVALVSGTWQGAFPAEGPYQEADLGGLSTLTNASRGLASLANELGRSDPAAPLDVEDLRDAAALSRPPGFVVEFNESIGMLVVSRPGSAVSACIAVSTESSTVRFEGRSWESPKAVVVPCPSSR